MKVELTMEEVLEKYKDEGYLLLGASNQSGVASGKLTHDMAVKCFEKTNEMLGIDIEYNFCPHGYFPVNCYCRKPMPGMGVEFIEKYKLDASKCIMVGNQKTDGSFARRCGFKFADEREFFN